MVKSILVCACVLLLLCVFEDIYLADTIPLPRTHTVHQGPQPILALGIEKNLFHILSLPPAIDLSAAMCTV